MSDEEMAAVVSGMLWTSYQELDRLERSLGALIGPAEPSGRPDPAPVAMAPATGQAPAPAQKPPSLSSHRAGLVGAALAEVLQVLRAHRHDLDAATVIHDLHSNVVAVMGTLAELMLQVSYPAPGDRADLQVAAQQVVDVMNTFAAAPAAPALPRLA